MAGWPAPTSSWSGCGYRARSAFRIGQGPLGGRPYRGCPRGCSGRDPVQPAAQADQRASGSEDIAGPVQQPPPAAQRPRIGQMADRLLHQRAQPGLATVVGPLRVAELVLSSRLEQVEQPRTRHLTTAQCAVASASWRSGPSRPRCGPLHWPMARPSGFLCTPLSAGPGVHRAHPGGGCDRTGPGHDLPPHLTDRFRRCGFEHDVDADETASSIALIHLGEMVTAVVGLTLGAGRADASIARSAPSGAELTLE